MQLKPYVQVGDAKYPGIAVSEQDSSYHEMADFYQRWLGRTMYWRGRAVEVLSDTVIWGSNPHRVLHFVPCREIEGSEG